MDLVLVAAAVMVLAVAMYVILDGFDLGVGIVFLFAPKTHHDLMIASISPVWDGNETWLVLGGATLFSAFPYAYSVLLPTWYVGIMVFLAALIFRGIAFEFRPESRRKGIWSFSFSAGSTLAAFAQGVLLGSFVQGFRFVDGRYACGTFGWLTPFSVMTGLALVCGYALLGVTWLILKTQGEVQEWCFRLAMRLLPGMLGFILLVSIWTPLTDAEIARRWFSIPDLFYLAPIPIVTALVGGLAWNSLQRGSERQPFIFSIALFMLAYLGLAISLWPYIVPRHYTLWQAASTRATLKFVLIGVLILLPLVLGYTIHTYRVFRGKVSPETGYR